MAEGNKGLWVGAVVAAGLFAVAAPSLRHVMVRLAVQDEVLNLGRFPNPDQIIGLKEKLTKIPTRYFVDEASVKTLIGFEERDMGPAGIQRFVTVSVDYGKSVTRDHRVETSMNEQFFEDLQNGGVPVLRLSGGDDDEDDEDDDDY